MSKTTRNHLSAAEQWKLNKYVEENHAEFDHLTYDQIAAAVSKDLGFAVTKANIPTAKKTVGVDWIMPHQGPAKAQCNCGMETIQLLAQQVITLYRGLGQETMPETLVRIRNGETAAQILGHDGADDE